MKRIIAGAFSGILLASLSGTAAVSGTVAAPPRAPVPAPVLNEDAGNDKGEIKIYIVGKNGARRWVGDYFPGGKDSKNPFWESENLNDEIGKGLCEGLGDEVRFEVDVELHGEENPRRQQCFIYDVKSDTASDSAYVPLDFLRNKDTIYTITYGPRVGKVSDECFVYLGTAAARHPAHVRDFPHHAAHIGKHKRGPKDTCYKTHKPSAHKAAKHVAAPKPAEAPKPEEKKA